MLFLINTKCYFILEIVKSNIEKPVEKLQDTIIQEVITFCNNQREDDITLFILRLESD